MKYEKVEESARRRACVSALAISLSRQSPIRSNRYRPIMRGNRQSLRPAPLSDRTSIVAPFWSVPLALDRFTVQYNTAMTRGRDNDQGPNGTRDVIACNTPPTHANGRTNPGTVNHMQSRACHSQ